MALKSQSVIGRQFLAPQQCSSLLLISISLYKLGPKEVAGKRKMFRALKHNYAVIL